MSETNERKTLLTLLTKDQLRDLKAYLIPQIPDDLEDSYYATSMGLSTNLTEQWLTMQGIKWGKAKETIEETIDRLTPGDAEIDRVILLRVLADY